MPESRLSSFAFCAVRQVVADAIDGYSHKAIEPNLEHAYVYYMDYLLKDKMNMQVEAIQENELFK